MSGRNFLGSRDRHLTDLRKRWGQGFDAETLRGGVKRRVRMAILGNDPALYKAFPFASSLQNGISLAQQPQYHFCGRNPKVIGFLDFPLDSIRASTYDCEIAPGEQLMS